MKTGAGLPVSNQTKWILGQCSWVMKVMKVYSIIQTVNTGKGLPGSEGLKYLTYIGDWGRAAG